MGQLMELEGELMPEKVALRLEKEARLQKEARLKEARLKEERLKEQAKQQPLLEKTAGENNGNKLNLQLGKPATAVRNTAKPTSLNIQLAHKKPTLPKPLSIDLPQTPPVLVNAANKYALPLAAQQLDHQQDVQNVSPNVNYEKPSAERSSAAAPKNPQPVENPKPTISITNSSSCRTNPPTSSSIPSSSSKSSSNGDCRSDGTPIPKSTSQPQLNSSINKSDKHQPRDTNNNNLDKVDRVQEPSPANDEPKAKPSADKPSTADDKPIVKPVAKPNGKPVEKTVAAATDNGQRPIKLTEKHAVSSEAATASKELRELRAPESKPTSSTASTTIQRPTAGSSQPRSMPSSSACTPSVASKQLTNPICLSDLLNRTTSGAKSVSQILNSNCSSASTVPATIGKQVKPLRPSTLFLNTNVPHKTKHNAITPSALCSPLTAFAVSSSTKSSPSISNLSSPYELNEKIIKRRWFAESAVYPDQFSPDFNPPECKKKNKQKKLKNISVEVN